MLGNIEGFYRLIHRLFLPPVDQKIRTGAGDPTDIGAVIGPEQEGLIRHTGLQAANIRDPGFRNMEDIGNKLHSRVVGTIYIRFIENAELL